MSRNPLETTPEREARIRQRAEALWEADGRPDGRESEFRERAEILIHMEEHPDAGKAPNPLNQRDRLPAGDGVDEAAIQENYGEFPDRFTDQGERQQTPMTRERQRGR